jgi:porphobilinogen synthase
VNRLDARYSLPIRPRRNRSSRAVRDLVRETELAPGHLVLPLFVIEGRDAREPISSMSGTARLSIDLIVEEARAAASLGVRAFALFPALDDAVKDEWATESVNRDGLLQRCIAELKEHVPESLVITDVAMDPYSTQGHDGYVHEGKIVNDPTLAVLAEMAVAQAEAGADVVAPSDMMDGRVGVIRSALDESGHENVGILAYSAKYASSFYGPFREALDSAPRHGDKRTYQMDPANGVEALREVRLDVQEGADMVMVKPALPYLDVIRRVKDAVDVPVAAYQVSGEYAMIQTVAERGFMDGDALVLESVTGIRRAGADVVLTYFARRLGELLQS